MKKGLYALAGESDTASDAAWAKRLEAPTTKLSKLYLGLNPISLAASDGCFANGQKALASFFGSGALVFCRTSSSPDSPRTKSIFNSRPEAFWIPKFIKFI